MVARRIKKLILRFLARRTRPLPFHRWQTLPRPAVKSCSCRFRLTIFPRRNFVPLFVSLNRLAQTATSSSPSSPAAMFPICFQPTLIFRQIILIFALLDCVSILFCDCTGSSRFPPQSFNANLADCRQLLNAKHLTNSVCFSPCANKPRAKIFNAGTVIACSPWPGVFPIRSCSVEPVARFVSATGRTLHRRAGIPAREVWPGAVQRRLIGKSGIGGLARVMLGPMANQCLHPF